MRKLSKNLLQEAKDIIGTHDFELPDEHILQIIGILNGDEVRDLEKFKRMLEFATQILLIIGLDEKQVNESLKSNLLAILKGIPSKKENANTEDVEKFMEVFRLYFNVFSQEEVGELIGYTRQGINKYSKLGYMSSKMKQAFTNLIIQK